jgi:integrase
MYPNKTTRRLYSESVRKFLEFLFGSGCNVKEEADRYVNSERDYELDVMHYFNDAINKWSPKYLGLQRAAIKLFLEEYDITIPRRTWRRIAKQKPIYTIQEDRLPTRDELRRIFRHLPLHGKALFFIMLSGGTRIGETRRLRLQDIDWDSDPLLIKLPGEITKNKYP